ncbi:efflux RND transporter permease subunit [Bacillus sp. FJAT-29790]|uniref:efflux RND transporter permease subunit n=1 Tax=Bacillus sp. FJAT-29790 TaxID=1895002 RepID=UPI001C247A28|nr:efflux RND transporter permease subunit [Bacillus sp. FJAT-29790]MBU8881123.1 efflux RND transporter permease subunit [Bacillus sp. FJAT-29790]
MKLIKGSINRPVGVIMIVVLALLVGVVALRNLAVDLYPKLDLPIAVIATSYPGAAPQEVEELISKPIEEAVGTIEGLDTIQSVSQPSSSLIIMQFDYGRDIAGILNDVREKLDRVTGRLPEDANSPMVMRIDPAAMPVQIISVTSTEHSLSDLQLIAENEIQPEFERAKGIASASLSGGVRREIRVDLDQGKLANFKLTGSQVVQALRGENRSVSAGTVERGGEDVQLRIDGEFTSVEDIKNTKISLVSGETIKVSDVAEVVDTFQEKTTISRVNGEDTLTLSIMKQSDANTISAAKEVQKVLDKLNKQFKERGVKLTMTVDTSTFISQSINSVVWNMIIGFGCAMVILQLFLQNVRATIVIGMTMPLSLLTAFILMYLTGETINTISMGGLAIGIGLMIDNGIVIIENVFKRKTEGMPIKEAALVGATELAPSVIAATLTTAAIFVPMLFINGIVAQMIRPLALTVVFAVTASLIGSLTLLPMLSSKLLGNVKETIEGEERKGLFNRLLNRLTENYVKLLKRALKFRKTVVAIVVVTALGSLLLIPIIGFQLSPDSDSGEMQIDITLKNGTQLAQTEETVREISDRLSSYEDIIDMTTITIGGSSGNMFGGASGSDKASFTIKLISASERDMSTKEFIGVVDSLLSDIAGAEIMVKENDRGMSSGSPIQIEITGEDLNVLGDLSQQVVWVFEGVEGTLNVKSSAAEGRPEVQVVVNRELASQYGLSYQNVMNDVSLAFNGQVATKYKEDGDEFDVKVSLPKESSQTIRDLETFVIRNNEGVLIPITAVAELKQVQGPTEINRKNRQRSVNVTSDVIGRNAVEVTKDIHAQLDQLTLPEGYEISTGGEMDDVMEQLTQLGIALILGIILVYMVMAFQFESFTYPFVIMFSIPTMIIGALVGLFVTNLSLTVPAFMGVIMLAAIVLNNGIILVDYTNILRRRGMERMEALIESGRSRLRPILMTSVTTVFTMIPIAIAIGEGAEANQPMAVVVIFGLIASTVLTLVFVPVMYVFIDNLAVKMKRLFTRKKSKEVITDESFSG